MQQKESEVVTICKRRACPLEEPANLTNTFVGKGVKQSEWIDVKLQFDSSSPRLRAQSFARGVKRRRDCGSSNHDGGDSFPRKKRRLRLELITSHLSDLFATPPTFVPARRTCRTGLWARARIGGRDLLRRAAIFNSIATKRRTSGMRGVDHRRLTQRAAWIDKKPPDCESIIDDAGEDYVAFDAYAASTDGSGDEDEGADDVYSDFNLLRDDLYDDVELAEEDYAFDGFGQTLTCEKGEKAMSLVLESEDTSKEVSVAPKAFVSFIRRGV
ncbi:uncharacterized protein KY384_004936 [Bacidia gigantensis]|uniref:uncharacterized protein n=1 Tax=Bacidia gigantensis TaxID=2732470 RepID=UPI001D054EAD|nr:uncharacterized protein KY384_004936 [Bacidia gigantensis]KAG8530434.1 hypothetical protein KY384_004936 [Bacidia gigantensis]